MTSFAGTMARLAFWSSVTVLGLFALLHVLEPEFDPLWRMMSEYSIGNFGWVMVTAFAVWTVSCLALMLAVWSQIVTAAGQVGLASLGITIVGLVMASIFTSDPLTLPDSEATVHGTWHAVAGMLCIPGFAVSAVLINTSLRRNAGWGGERTLLLVTGHLPWMTLAWLVVTMNVTLPQNHNRFGPAVPIGIPNRFMVAAFSVWIITTAIAALRVRRAAFQKTQEETECVIS